MCPGARREVEHAMMAGHTARAHARTVCLLACCCCCPLIHTLFLSVGLLVCVSQYGAYQQEQRRECERTVAVQCVRACARVRLHVCACARRACVCVRACMCVLARVCMFSYACVCVRARVRRTHLHGGPDLCRGHARAGHNHLLTSNDGDLPGVSSTPATLVERRGR